MDLNHADKLAFGPFHDLADVDPGAIPDGYVQMPIFGPFHEAQGPMYVKREKVGHVVGLRVEEVGREGATLDQARR